MRPPRANIRAILLDLDGTLLDTAPDIAGAANRLLASLGREPLPEARIRDFIGRGIANLVERVLAETGGDPAPLGRDGAQARFEAFYLEGVADRSAPYPGVLEGLRAFQAAGLALGCVTNKASRFTEPLLAATGLRPFFGAVVSGDEVTRKKPAPEAIVLAARRLGVEPVACWVIGDSANDVISAKAAGAVALVVPYGYREGFEVEALGADAVVSGIDEAARWITMAA